MQRPTDCSIHVVWLDENEVIQTASFDETDIEEAITLLSLMSGDITEEDLKS